MRTLNRVRQNIIRIRQEKGYTQERLAYEAGISKGYLNEFENGKKGVSVTTLDKLTDVLDVDVIEFFRKPKKK